MRGKRRARIRCEPRRFLMGVCAHCRRWVARAACSIVVAATIFSAFACGGVTRARCNDVMPAMAQPTIEQSLARYASCRSYRGTAVTRIRSRKLSGELNWKAHVASSTAFDRPSGRFRLNYRPSDDKHVASPPFAIWGSNTRGIRSWEQGEQSPAPELTITEVLSTSSASIGGLATWVTAQLVTEKRTPYRDMSFARVGEETVNRTRCEKWAAGDSAWEVAVWIDKQTSSVQRTYESLRGDAAVLDFETTFEPTFDAPMGSHELDDYPPAKDVTPREGR